MRVKEAREFFTGIQSPDGVVHLAQHGVKRPWDKNDVYLLEDTVKSRGAAVMFLRKASAELSPRERQGIVYITGLTVRVDTIIDRKSFPRFDNPDAFKKYLFENAASSLPSPTVGELLERTQACFPEHKHHLINEYIDTMCEVHTSKLWKGKPGEYSFEDALNYRKLTDDASVELCGKLADLTEQDIAEYKAMFLVSQFVDDALDWRKDAQEGNVNLFLGLANDVWRKKEMPLGQDLDLIQKLLLKNTADGVQDWRVLIQGLKSKGMADTRKTYKKLANRTISQLPKALQLPTQLLISSLL